MAVEIQMLVYASILGLVQLLTAAHFSTMQRGAKWNVSSREGEPKPLTGVAGRTDRAFKNFMETFPIFAALALVGYVSQQESFLIVLGAQIYLVARVLHFIVYSFGIAIVRSLIWLASMVGILLMIVGVL